MFNRLLRMKYGYSEAFTPEMYIRLHPLQTHRRKEMSKLEVGAVRQLVPGFLVCGPATEEIASLVRRVALTDMSVTIEGETGVGKEGVANALHMYSARNQKPFIPINCASISEGIAESELFGHERGSFTGSQKQTEGLFRGAHTGSIFFDEIEVLPYTIQGKLLRVLESGEVRPVGSTKVQMVDVRTIVATNQNLQQLCATRQFRQDLFHRLNGITIRIPPLRERKEEIPVLARYLLSRISGRKIVIDDKVMQLFLDYSWPGNVRELKHVLTRAHLYVDKGCASIKESYLPDEIRTVSKGRVLRSAS